MLEAEGVESPKVHVSSKRGCLRPTAAWDARRPPQIAAPWHNEPLTRRFVCRVRQLTCAAGRCTHPNASTLAETRPVRLWKKKGKATLGECALTVRRPVGHKVLTAKDDGEVDRDCECDILGGRDGRRAGDPALDVERERRQGEGVQNRVHRSGADRVGHLAGIRLLAWRQKRRARAERGERETSQLLAASERVEPRSSKLGTAHARSVQAGPRT